MTEMGQHPQSWAEDEDLDLEMCRVYDGMTWPEVAAALNAKYRNDRNERGCCARYAAILRQGTR